MRDVMLDLETMGKCPDAAIIAIGAVEFDVKTPQIGEKFYALVNLESAVLSGRGDGRVNGAVVDETERGCAQPVFACKRWHRSGAGGLLALDEGTRAGHRGPRVGERSGV